MIKLLIHALAETVGVILNDRGLVDKAPVLKYISRKVDCQGLLRGLYRSSTPLWSGFLGLGPTIRKTSPAVL